MTWNCVRSWCSHLFYLLILFYFWDRISLYRAGWPQRDLPASAPWVLGLKVTSSCLADFHTYIFSSEIPLQVQPCTPTFSLCGSCTGISNLTSSSPTSDPTLSLVYSTSVPPLRPSCLSLSVPMSAVHITIIHPRWSYPVFAPSTYFYFDGEGWQLGWDTGKLSMPELYLKLSSNVVLILLSGCSKNPPNEIMSP